MSTISDKIFIKLQKNNKANETDLNKQFCADGNFETFYH